ncbi:MAG: PDZ domain-containing protein [Acidobacteriota bacterium]
MPRLFLLVTSVLLLFTSGPRAATALHYHFTFPEPQHHWMQVEATFPELTGETLELRMSRASPGRYSLHDFAKNVYDVHAFARDGRELPVTRPDPYGWNVSDHGGSVRVVYKIYGDVVDGTYLAVDTTHAHINMPAAVMWARGLDDRPSTLTFAPPAGTRWQIATQLHPGATPFEVTAPNLQYLMDSPVELGPISIKQFSVGPRTFRVAVHHQGGDGDLGDYVKDIEKIVRQEGAVFGEYPAYEPGHYTFLADYLPYASGDGMEHRNSTVMTEAASIATGRRGLLDTVAHEFFHGWNVERIRPRSIEPFDFERANMSGELWLAEGFTQYYGKLIVQRAGLADLQTLAQALTDFVETAAVAPGRSVRSAEEMSRMAPFMDGGTTVDRTNWPNSVTSYYPLGGAIALALDLTLRGRSDSAITLDDYMRAMWRVHGRPGGAREGYVDRPYTAADAEARLADVSADPAFARDFFSRYIQGREAADYPALLGRGGFVVRRRNPDRAWWGDVRLEPRNGRMSIAALVPANTPAYAAGLEQDDELRQLDGVPISSFGDLANVLARHKPGDRVAVAYVDRTGLEKTATVVLAEDPHLEVVPNESEGIALSPAQRRFRDRWLGPLQSVQ